MKVGDKVKVTNFVGVELDDVEGTLVRITKKTPPSRGYWYTVKIEKTRDAVVYLDEEWTAQAGELKVIDSPKQK